jgi:brefeldin A-inhibited guanine nucleotide-exchange protein
MIQLSLEGFRCAIRVASLFFMETERNAFVSSLTKFTYLINIREMKQKNIESIKTLIQIANSDGNYLQDSWTQVLNCISQLERLQILGTNSKSAVVQSANQSK